MGIQGIETTMGYVSWIGKKEEKESILVTLLLNAGAVFYVKTSVPQSLMTCETVNNIIGRTTNPRNKEWSCGGSSGGEGAIIGLRGGIIGVGTDIGRLRKRVPKFYCLTMLMEPNRWFNPSPIGLQLPLRSAS